MAEDSRKLSQKFDRSIVEGQVGPAVWGLAWPTMLQNAIAGLQGIIDHAMVGHFVGYTANAAIGVSWQIIIVVVVFVSSLFTGMAVLVARFCRSERSREGESGCLPGLPDIYRAGSPLGVYRLLCGPEIAGCCKRGLRRYRRRRFRFSEPCSWESSG